MKAFRTVNHTILPQKLSSLGVDDASRAWFFSFLTNRKQVTGCNDVSSEVAPVPIGVAQDSMLGPLLFIIYMNDLPDVLKFWHVTLYLHDTVLYIASKSAVDLQRKINADLGHTVYVRFRFRADKLTVIVKKSNFLLIGSSFRLSKVGSIHISADNVHLDNVECYTYLGTVINNRFSWSDHIDYICGTISKKLGLLRCIKSCLPLNARITFLNRGS